MIRQPWILFVLIVSIYDDTTLALPYSKTSLYEELFRQDQNLDKIEITIEKFDGSLSDIGSVIDSFLAPRPWWRITSEPYAFRNSDMSQLLIILHRVDKKWDELLKFISNVQFPSTCEDKYLYVAHEEGFDSLGHLFSGWNTETFFTFHTVFVPYIIDPKVKRIFYLDDNYCEGVLNKIECIFLPSTNCTLPKVIQDAAVQDIRPTSKFFSNASYDGTLLEMSVIMGMNQKTTDYDKYIDSLKIDLPSYFNYQHTDGLKSKIYAYNARQLILTYGILYRFNYAMRSMINQELDNFQKRYTQPFPTDGQCIAAHIRRTDRIPPKEEKNWCYSHTFFDNNRTCYNQETKTFYESWGNCIKSIDYACNTDKPFESITLYDIIQISSKMNNNINNILIVTDDNEFINQQIITYKNDIPKNKNLFIYAAPKNHRNKTTTNGVAYFSSLELFTKCNVFIGHSASSVSTLITSLMCAQHGDKFGECPPFYDFSGWRP